MKRSFRVLRAMLMASLLLIALAVCASATELKIGVGIVDASSLRLRASASTDADVITHASNGDYVVIIRQTDDWYLVDYNLNIGYVSSDYVTFKSAENVELGVATVNTSVVNVRSGPSSDSSSVGQLTEGSAVNIIGINDCWYKVTYGSNVGYIRSDLLVLTECPYSNSQSTIVGAVDTPVYVSEGQKLVDCAMNYLGVPYVWGGTTPNGFDCSGFTKYVCNQMGYYINRVAADQMANGYQVTQSELQPGDLVFFANTYSSSAAATHVGIYIGNGKFIHAASGGVKITNLSDSYYAVRYAGARRIV